MSQNYLVNETDTFKVKIDVDISKKRPKAVFVPSQKTLLKPDQLKTETAEFYFLNYGMDNRIRSESRTTLPDGRTTIDITKYEENRIRYLLKDWSLGGLTGKLELKREAGKLTEEAFNVVMRIDPTIVQAFLNKASEVWDLGAEEEQNFTNTAPPS